MDPFDSQNPLQPFGFPGDPMEDVLSLQAYNNFNDSIARPAEPIDTIGCTTVGCTTVGCTVGC